MRFYYKLLAQGWDPDLAGRVASDYQWCLERRASGEAPTLNGARVQLDLDASR